MVRRPLPSSIPSAFDSTAGFVVGVPIGPGGIASAASGESEVVAGIGVAAGVSAGAVAVVAAAGVGSAAAFDEFAAAAVALPVVAGWPAVEAVAAVVVAAESGGGLAAVAEPGVVLALESAERPSGSWTTGRCCSLDMFSASTRGCSCCSPRRPLPALASSTAGAVRHCWKSPAMSDFAPSLTCSSGQSGLYLTTEPPGWKSHWKGTIVWKHHPEDLEQTEFLSLMNGWMQRKRKLKNL